ncbi:hypothetical protein IQ270_06710 [Microcoleus sp. LEGE 07076]|uniref:hypothetical protein n=1 Tax=Microcoleus sp. LEGE 07076 TaxID=915322 RepID=UPI00187FAFEE|nr:hypothetical protein [Microcoleus sp. LEGE 07076]MBE9184419.1 hypothetical protein [Microcoleus sp. LEGE 07076]
MSRVIPIYQIYVRVFVGCVAIDRTEKKRKSHNSDAPTIFKETTRTFTQAKICVV